VLLKWWWKLETSQKMNVAMDYWEEIQNLIMHSLVEKGALFSVGKGL
jgi:hypothetical protein